MNDWVACVGKGWAPLVTALVDRCESEDVEIHQVKEKYGGLRFYTGPASLELDKAIAQAERDSFQTCEDCGKPGSCVSLRGYYRTLCAPCAERCLIKLGGSDVQES